MSHNFLSLSCVATLFLGALNSAIANVSFMAGLNPNSLIVTFEQDLRVTITPSGSNQFFGDGSGPFGFAMRNAYSSSNTLGFVNPTSIVNNTISTTSTGTFDISQTNPVVADFSFGIAALGATDGIFEDTDFFLGVTGDNVYIPDGGTGIITFSAGSFEITNWTFAIPDQTASVLIVATGLGGAATNTVVGFVPEPSCYTLIFGGLALAGAVTLRRRKEG
ncbi:PEP-CTERM sorting domain-containing protein [Coraliomargarita akajimensis]|uniref:PEP-CTERM protein-sorting domain-containing protein n=1 Tax=Coraliomargarita akajimensis (strain DSM 45221 / IAM 15411 / JCM 23193 / KCTC 12865 / 04OKA010-24) TaxID=583355 RepID=D5EL69_CORAD|nr:PEP-CTERM sorting domain-containing protein [Coraliomargarita akajimensis]ADE53171.1 protein of unknown function DUF1555 [Coraliomargarita akajimensis DSM 45221]